MNFTLREVFLTEVFPHTISYLVYIQRVAKSEICLFPLFQKVFVLFWCKIDLNIQVHNKIRIFLNSYRKMATQIADLPPCSVQRLYRPPDLPACSVQRLYRPPDLPTVCRGCIDLQTYLQCVEAVLTSRPTYSVQRLY